MTPNIIYLRRSVDAGATWTKAVALLRDPQNGTEFGGAPVVDPMTGNVHLVYTADVFEKRCSGCPQWIISSTDDGASWSTPKPLHVNGPSNTTWGGALASGIALTRGPHAGRLLVALRHDCCGHLRSSFVVYSDDHGATWTGGNEMVLLPEYGGGWTECQVAELQNGSVLMTSRNFYARSSGQGPRLFARSDDGGHSWAANWSAGGDLPDPYCEASLISDPASGLLFFGNPSNSRERANFSVHTSRDGGRTWPDSFVVYPGGAAYSDMSLIGNRRDKIAIFFEKDNYATVAFGVVSPPAPAPALGIL